MPYRMTWEDESRGVFAEYWGRISADDLTRICHAVTADPRWDDVRYVIADASRIDGIDVDTSTAAALAEPNVLLIGAARDHAPVQFAVVTTNGELLHLLQRQRELQAFPYPTQVFENVAAARRWLVQSALKTSQV